ncbi:tRNA epoxyqueuosine(34) reductase QueG [Parendozoicomonas sp. Alg238-R29]|uniref:tRNA epoxyqueuosine(34) reductase QueG n=1 Tax=Parendozoicomonas sp. Alg238-R29 TaxID=2993446 RepID=UPI00248D92EF|nr:tRNA epoxyqueuosine(34) reductase QueG [Parendozoicomonas sp. Alg238-R29]
MTDSPNTQSIPIRPVLDDTELEQLAVDIKRWARELGFQDAGITDIDLGEHEQHLKNWLARDFHGEMDYMASHGNMRSRPDELVPGTLRIISVRMDYLTGDTQAVRVLKQPEKAYISRYSLGRDYHKVIRKRITQLGKRIEEKVGKYGYRAFVDSAPVLEKAIAEKAGLGWIGKNTLLLNNKAGSWFFLGELFTNLPLPVDKPQRTNHCGSCFACADICPTNAIIAPHQLDARRCISYLTIELKGSIPEEFRKAIGNRVFGCDDCQIICPWNKFAKHSGETDFLPRHKLDSTDLADLFLWTEEEFLERTAGSPIRRTGFEGWLRNLAVGLGNAPSTKKVINALKARKEHPSDMVREHVKWALKQHT